MSTTESSVMMTVRLPVDCKKWLEAEARRTFVSQNTAIVTALRRRMAAERVERAERVAGGE